MAEDSQPLPDAPAAAPKAQPRLPEPIQEVLAQLESRIAALRLREAHHAKNAAFHQSEQKRYAEQLAELEKHHEALRTAAAAAVQVVQANTVPSPLATVEYSPQKRLRIRQLVQKALEWQVPGEPFSPSFLTRHLNQSLHGTDHPAVTVSQISTVLRRLAQEGRLRLAQPGRPHHEALYAK